MHDNIVKYIRDHDNGVASIELAQQFLKFKSPDPLMAHIAIRAILQNDTRCFSDQEGRWFIRASKIEAGSIAIKSVNWVAIYVVTKPNSNRKVCQISIWKTAPTIECLRSVWLENPSSLSFEDQDQMVNAADEIVSKPLDELFSEIVSLLKNSVVVFFSAYHRSLFTTHCTDAGIWPPEDTTLCSELMRVVNIKAPRPLTLETVVHTITGKHALFSDARTRGASFAQIVSELVTTINLRGIETIEELDRKEIPEISFNNKKFTINDILSLPEKPGVYGFKDKSGEYIYIGKAKNLKRRVLCYFRESDESPVKLAQLRQDSFEFTVAHCGSELESLLYEYRLIKKYQPLLNRQISIAERQGTFTPFPDSIILLPHTKPTMGLSVWYRNGQKILLKPFDIGLTQSEEFIKELEHFFYSEKLSPDENDFPEQEIAFRWVRRHRDNLFIVPVHRLSGAPEIFLAIQSYWKDLQESQNLNTQ